MSRRKTRNERRPLDSFRAEISPDAVDMLQSTPKMGGFVLHGVCMYLSCYIFLRCTKTGQMVVNSWLLHFAAPETQIKVILLKSSRFFVTLKFEASRRNSALQQFQKLSDMKSRCCFYFVSIWLDPCSFGFSPGCSQRFPVIDDAMEDESSDGSSDQLEESDAPRRDKAKLLEAQWNRTRLG